MKPVQRALIFLGLLIVAIAVGIGALRRGGGPNPITEAQAWVDWAEKDPIAGFVGVVSAVLAGIGAVGALTAMFGPKPMSERDSRRGNDRVRTTVEDQAETTRRHTEAVAEAQTTKILAALAEARLEGAVTDPTGDQRQVDAVREMVRSEDPADRRAADLIGEGRVEEGFALLRREARTADHEAAVRWRRLGDLAYGVSVSEALAAYSEAAARDPDHHWTHVTLRRLHTVAGDLANARVAAVRAIETASDERDRSVGNNELGDVARAEGDLPAARKAYGEGLAIARDLSARDPGNTEWKRDLSVSLNKLGDVAGAEGDLPAARTAYEEGLAIRLHLSARDPSNTEWKRDLSVSHERLGDVAGGEGDLPAARAAYDEGLAIRRHLSARDPGNTAWKRDLSVSLYKLGNVAIAEGHLPAARTAYEEALAIVRDLSARDPGNTEWKRDLAISQAKLGQLAEAEGNRDGAREAFLDAERQFRAILEISPNHVETRRMADLAAAEAARLAE